MQTILAMSTIMSISIIIPIYNSGVYIGACIDSVFSQECDEADLECILVNDCTSDNSMEIVNNKLNSYNGDIHFKVIHLDKNSGHCVQVSEFQKGTIYSSLILMTC